MNVIIYQSAVSIINVPVIPFNTAPNAPIQQISNLNLEGIKTISDNFTCDSNGKLYGTFQNISGNYTLNIYNDVTLINLIASATSNTFGIVNVIQQNNSGITGNVNFIQYVQDDDLIYFQVLLTNDNDIPLGELQVLTDYDPVYGFEKFHEIAFYEIRRIVTGRYRSILYNRNWIDSKQINGGMGGADLSTVLNWFAFKEAAEQYVLYKICQRQYVETDSIWDKRSKEAMMKFKAYMETVECEFDMTHQRIESKSRAGCTFKIGRS